MFALRSTPTPASTPKPTPDAVERQEQRRSAAALEDWIIRFTNKERERNNLEPFTRDEAVSAIARKHSANMALRNVLSHYVDGKNATDRGREANYRCHSLGENIHKGSWDWNAAKITEASYLARQIVNEWKASPNYRRKILNPRYHRLGVGVTVAADPEPGTARSLDLGHSKFPILRVRAAITAKPIVITVLGILRGVAAAVMSYGMARRLTPRRR